MHDAAYNAYKGDKSIEIYQFNNHEGGAVYQMIEKLKFLDALFPERG